jgi:transposase
VARSESATPYSLGGDGHVEAVSQRLQAHAPQAAILFDKFHVLRHLGQALDTVRKREYARLTGKQRQYIKGQKYTLLSRRDNLTLEGRQALKTLLAANKRLNTAYLLRESFGQLWSYEREGWARRFFENWRASLKWQRLKPYEKFAEMIDRHWDGIAAYCKPQNKVALGFVEGLNNKIRVIQRRAYGLRDEEYLRPPGAPGMCPSFHSFRCKIFGLENSWRRSALFRIVPRHAPVS